jgi:hypothetical protein
MNLIDSYVTEVGKYLPRRNRSDIEAEIRSTLEDMLEERAQGQGPASEAQVVALLKEYGEPRKVAASYGAIQYLIGPRLFPFFEMVTKIVLAALALGLTVSFGIGTLRSGLTSLEMARALGNLFLQYLSGGIAAFGNIVLVFAILERVLPAKEQETMKDEWNPADLTKAPNPDEIKPAEQIVSVIVTIVGLVILNGFPQIIGLYFFSDEKWTYVPILAQAFFRYLPWINILSALQIGLDLWLLQQGTWKPASRIFSIALKACSVALLIAMATGPAIVQLTAASVAGTPLAEVFDEFGPLLKFMITPVLLLAVLGTLIEIGQTGWKLVQPKPSQPIAVKK